MNRRSDPIRQPIRQVMDCKPATPTTYRYRLCVRLGTGPALTLIQKNPSLADKTRRDPTVGKVEAWARRQGFGMVTYLNLFAYRSAHPAALNALSYEEAVGSQNDAVLEAALQRQTLVVAAWGNPNGVEPLRYARRISAVLEMVNRFTNEPLHVVGGWTKAGHPLHGLHWNGAAPLREWGVGGRE